MQVIDAHHHIWRKDDLPWLSDGRPRIFGDYTALQRDYPIEEYAADVAPCNVVKSVYVQANWPADRALDEARWVHETGRRHGMPNAVVAFAALDAPDCERLLDAYAAIPSVRGIRHQIHWHSKAALSYVAVPDLFDDATWRAGLRAVGDRGLSFDLQVFPGQMAGAAAMVGDFPDISFVLNHAGMLDARDAATLATWRAGLAALAARPNVYVKFSGLGTFDRTASVDLVRPIVETSLALFGASRCLYGSNFPIEKLWTTYPAYFRSVWDAVGPVPEADRRAIFHDTAARVYRLG